MGFFGDSQQEKELKTLMQQASETMNKLVDNANANPTITAYARTLINQLGNEVNLLYIKSETLSPAKQMSMQVTIGGYSVPFANGKIGFVMFMNDFTRRTGERFPHFT